MKYRCSHCNHVFELADREFKRCPKCFWTTSLIPDEPFEKTPEKPAAEQPQEEKRRTINTKIFKGLFLFLAVLFLIIAGVYFVIQNWDQIKSFKIPSPEPGTISPKKLQKKEQQKKQAAVDLSNTLNPEDREFLARKFQVTVPRQLSDDEEEILKKQVSLPSKLNEKPQITRWTKKDFETLLTKEQKQKKINLGWSYTRALTKVFEKNYEPALKAYDQGNYAEARALLLKSLDFPVYRNKRELHRAVALVMLRPYLNDVIGKIATLNQFLIGQQSASEINSIYQSYDELFPVLELHEWPKALPMMAQLKERIRTFENQPKEQAVPYPPFLAQLDPEIQAAIQQEAGPKGEGPVSLKALSVDLDLKEKTVRSNTSEELTKAQKQYEQAVQAIEAKDWQTAYDLLRAIEFPPELVDDAKNKLAVIEKMLAVNSESEKQQGKGDHNG